MNQLALNIDDEWRAVPGWPMYRVSRYGGIESRFSGTWRPVQCDVGQAGHLRVRLCDGHGRQTRIKLHALVLTVFVGPCPPGLEGCHNDGNPRNNHVSNLRWDTHSANAVDRERHGRGVTGVRNPTAKLTPELVAEIRQRRAAGEILKNIAALYGVTFSQVSNICRGKSWRSAA